MVLGLTNGLRSQGLRLCLLQAGLPGFYDPCVGEEKNLKVLYQFRGVLHQVMALDNEALRIPKQCEYLPLCRRLPCARTRGRPSATGGDRGHQSVE